MRMVALSESDPERCTLQRALREKRGCTEAQIEQLSVSDLHDRVELAMALEEEFGIQIADEEFLMTNPGDDADEPKS